MTAPKNKRKLGQSHKKSGRKDATHKRWEATLNRLAPVKTPLVDLSVLTGSGARILGKAEWLQRTGSVKYRPVWFIIHDIIQSGELDGRTLLTATSGNFGYALASLARQLEIGSTIIMPEDTAGKKREAIEAEGAKIILSPAKDGTAGAVDIYEKLIEEQPEKYYGVDQFKHPANIKAHSETTGREIIEQTDGKVDMIVAGVGSGGTIIGMAKAFEEAGLLAGVKIVGVMPKLGVRIEGLRNYKGPSPSQLLRKNIKYVGELVEISKDEMSEVENVKKRALEEAGLDIGPSSAAAVYVALREAAKLKKGATVVVMLPDSGERYR